MKNQGLRDKISLDARGKNHPEKGEKVERNREMISRYIEGESPGELMREYKISHTRFYQIADRFKKPGYRDDE